MGIISFPFTLMVTTMSVRVH